MRIGLISDTHLSSGRLPPAILDALQGVERILHAGDLVTLDVLRHLEAIAPVTAVQGNMDLGSTRLKLPFKIVLEVEGHQIGLIHGHGVPNPNRVLPPPIDFDAMHRYLLSEFQDVKVDCIVYGHTHQAHVEIYHNILMINPGSATHGKSGRGTLGLLTIHQGEMQAEIIQLV